MDPQSHTSGREEPGETPVEQEAVRTTIVGGRPPGSGKSLPAIPRGMEILLKKAAVDPAFRTLLLSKRSAAGAEIGLALEPAEAAMLDAVPAAQLQAIIDRTHVPEASRRAFLGQAAAVMLAALGASAVVASDASAQSRGISPKPPPGPRPVPGTGTEVAPPPVRPPLPVSRDQPFPIAEKFDDTPEDQPPRLVCELAGLPARATRGSRVNFRAVLTAPGSDKVELVPLLNRTGVSTGTGLGVEIRELTDSPPADLPASETRPSKAPASSSAGAPFDGLVVVAGLVMRDDVPKPAPATQPARQAEIPVPQRPPFVYRPADILSVAPFREVLPGRKMTVPVTLRLPDKAGRFEVRGFLRSWAYADPAAKTTLDAGVLRERFIHRINTPVVKIELIDPPEPPPVEKPPDRGPGPAPTGIRPGSGDGTFGNRP